MDAQADAKDDTENAVTTVETNDVTYELTATTFTKTSRLPLPWKRLDGSFFLWFRIWNHERIANEAKALRLVSNNTKIPVPKLLDHGVHPDGRQYLVTELIPGVLLSEFKRDCSRTKECIDQAYSNALEFIQDVVLPQLATLKSHERGIDGFVMPPCWLSPDVHPPWRGSQHRWKTLPLNEAKYVFQHGDIAAHNIIMDSQTLQVKALIDWEYAGFFPPGMEMWPGTLDSDVYEERGSQPAQAIEKFLPVDYLECYDKWDDKAELEELIERGELPHPDRLRQAGEAA